MTEQDVARAWPGWCRYAGSRGACDPQGAVQEAIARVLHILPVGHSNFEPYVVMRIKDEAKRQHTRAVRTAQMVESILPWVQAGCTVYEALDYAVEPYPQDKIARENREKTRCPQGHPYSADNTKVIRGKRYCRTCKREGMRRLRARNRRTA